MAAKRLTCYNCVVDGDSCNRIARSWGGRFERKAHRDATPHCNKKCFIYLIAIVFGLSGMAGAA